MGKRKTRLCLVLGLALVGVAAWNLQAQAKPKHAQHAISKAHVSAKVKATKAKATKAKSKSARSASPALLTLVSKTPNDAPDVDYRARIQAAQKLVAEQPVRSGDLELDAAGNLTHFVWVLAVGKTNGPLSVVRMDETGKNDQGLSISWAVDNFINTRFKIAGPDGYIVFAQRRPVHAKDGSYQEAVYTAYSPELDTKTMRDAGLAYLQDLQKQAFEQIKTYDVRSLVAPRLTVADKLPKSMLIRLMITEHIDPLHMRYVGMEQCVHEVLVTLAANGGNSYAYAKSSAGALGLPQFVASSYDMVRKNYPDARLEPDFQLGMTNLPNAMLASALLLDLELTELPGAYLKKITATTEQFAAYLAAGYNRNPAHVVKTYQRTHSFTGGAAPLENKLYVRIQSWVGNFLKKQYNVG